MKSDGERPIRYVLYLSHARHDQPDPYRQQRERMKRFASASGLNVVRIVEEPEPNSRSPRAGLVEVWRMIEADKANGILCEGTFRITRGVTDILQLHAALNSQHTNLQSLRTLHDDFRKLRIRSLVRTSRPNEKALLYGELPWVIFARTCLQNLCCRRVVWQIGSGSTTMLT